MTRKAIIIVLSLLAVVTGVAYLVTAVSSPWEFRFGEFEVIFEDGELVVSRAGPFIRGMLIPYLRKRPLDFSLWIVPLWVPFILFGFYPTIVFTRGPLRRWRDRRRLKAGSCNVCEYDLTGNVSGVCPECGTSLTPEKPT